MPTNISANDYYRKADLGSIYRLGSFARLLFRTCAADTARIGSISHKRGADALDCSYFVGAKEVHAH